MQNSAAKENICTDKQLRSVLLKATKNDLPLSVLVKSSKYDEWKPIQISESFILFKLL